MPASTENDLYRTHLPQWETVRDCVEGAYRIKHKGKKYLPKPNPEDTSAENDQRYADYKNRANFVNFTGHTLDGLIGMVFRKAPQSDLPTVIEYLKTNANGGGLTLDQMARSIISHQLQTGRIGLLVDYPEAEQGLTRAQIAALNLQANILQYSAESIINWEAQVIGGVKKLSLVVLQEDHVIDVDGFDKQHKTYHRVLRLVDGVYIQTLYNENDEPISTATPRDAQGKMWTEIPFIFAGAVNNDEQVDKSPLYDIAEINISHYRNSADFEESCFLVGQPTPYFGGLSQSWVDEIMKGGVILGSRAAALLPEGGTAGLIQAAPNQMPSEGMAQKEQQMIRIGAKIIEDKSGQETVDAARMRFAGQNSQLSTIVGNAESALEQCFQWCLQYMGGEGDATVELNKEFYDKRLEPQMVIAQIQLLDRGLIADSDMRDNLRAGGVIDSERTDEDIDNEIGQQNPLQ